MDAEVTAKASANLVAVKVMDRKECRDLLRTPMERVDETKRTLSNGTIAQGTNLVLGGGLLALGIAGFASIGTSCSKSPDASTQNPNPASRPCTLDEQKKQDNSNAAVGAISTGLALVPIGLFVWNIFRAKDERTTAPLEPKLEESGWKACTSQPMANAPIVMTAGRVTVNSRTNDQGEATLDISPIASASIEADPVNALVTVIANGTSASASVSLTDTPAYDAWKAAALKDANTKKAEQAAKTEEEAAHTAQVKTEHARAALGELEQGLAALRTPKWTDEQRTTFFRLSRLVEQIGAEKDNLTEPERRRMLAAGKRLDALLPGYNAATKAATREQERRDAEAANQRTAQAARETAAKQAARQKALASLVPLGRQAVLGHIRSPSTANFISDRLINEFQCASGKRLFVLEHTLDAQNGFGAMVRDTVNVIVNADNGKAFVVGGDMQTFLGLAQMGGGTQSLCAFSP